MEDAGHLDPKAAASTATGAAERAAARVLHDLSIAICALPAAWLALFAALVLRARLHQGFWPRHVSGFERLMDPAARPSVDPKTFPLHHGLIEHGLQPVVLALLAGPFVLLALLHPSARAPHRAWFALYVLAGLGVLTLLRVDPGGLWDWFLD